MNLFIYQLLIIYIALIAVVDSFQSFHQMKYRIKSDNSIGSNTNIKSSLKGNTLNMGLFDSFFAPKKTASASHILIKGNTGAEFLTKLKSDLEKSKNMNDKFAEAAAEYSACPSGKKGGSLGTFSQGQMVPTFDKVVFNEEVGKIHGPVLTPFGAHLILIESRSS